MKYTLTVEYNENSDEYYIIFPEKLLKELKWNAGDSLDLKVNKDGSLSIKKVK